MLQHGRNHVLRHAEVLEVKNLIRAQLKSAGELIDVGEYHFFADSGLREFHHFAESRGQRDAGRRVRRWNALPNDGCFSRNRCDRISPGRSNGSGGSRPDVVRHKHGCGRGSVHCGGLFGGRPGATEEKSQPSHQPHPALPDDQGFHKLSFCGSVAFTARSGFVFSLSTRGLSALFSSPQTPTIKGFERLLGWNEYGFAGD